jgi:hypothetical protein
MSELSQSNNPRVRRAYAHVILGKLANDEVNLDTAWAAVRRADQTRKGEASHFNWVLSKAAEQGAEKRQRDAREAYDEALRHRPTIDCDVEIITGVPLPDGGFLPMVIGAGSHEDFGKAYGEGEEIARGPLGQQGATSHVFRRMAETGGLEAELAFYKGVMLGQLVGRPQPGGPAENPAVPPDPA